MLRVVHTSIEYSRCKVFGLSSSFSSSSSPFAAPSAPVSFVRAAPPLSLQSPPSLRRALGTGTGTRRCPSKTGHRHFQLVAQLRVRVAVDWSARARDAREVRVRQHSTSLDLLAQTLSDVRQCCPLPLPLRVTCVAKDETCACSTFKQACKCLFMRQVRRVRLLVRSSYLD